MSILIFALSLVPIVLVYRWLKKRKAEDEVYKKICLNALKRGAFLCAAGVLVLSGLFYIIDRILVVLGVGDVIMEIYYNFILLALSEELVKYWALKGLIKKNPYPYSRIDLTSCMMIIGLGFQITESIAYAFGASAGMMLMRGLTLMHCGYGFIMGFFVGKAMETGKKQYTMLGILIPFLIHGTYDYCLGDVIGSINKNVVYISLALAVVAIFTIIGAIWHIHKAENKAEYQKALL